MNYISMWEEFRKTNNLDDIDYGVYEYDQDDILKLLNGSISAEISPYEVIRKNDYAIPFVGDYNIVVNDKEEAICIIKTVNVLMIPFNDIKENIAQKLGFSNLKVFKEDYSKILEKEMKEINMSYDENTICVIEEFEIVK